MASNWFYGKNGQQVGPVSSGQLRQLAQAGQLLPDDLVWKEGMAAWVPASSVPGLFSQTKQNTDVRIPQPEQVVPNVPAPSSSNLNVLLGCGGGAVALIMLCCCGGMFFGGQSLKAARKDLAEADVLWTQGQKAEAVTKYKSVVRDHLDVIADDQRTTVFQRIIETDVEAGDNSSAKVFIQKALDRNISLSLSGQDAKRLYAEAQSEREAKRLAKANRASTEPGDENIDQENRGDQGTDRGKPGAKLKALQAVVDRLKKAPDRFAGSTAWTKFNSALGEDVDRFVKIPFDAKKNREEGIKIMHMYQNEIERNYRGSALNELVAEIGKIQLHLTQ